MFSLSSKRNCSAWLISWKIEVGWKSNELCFLCSGLKTVSDYLFILMSRMGWQFHGLCRVLLSADNQMFLYKVEFSECSNLPFLLEILLYLYRLELIYSNLVHIYFFSRGIYLYSYLSLNLIRLESMDEKLSLVLKNLVRRLKC